MTTRLRSDHARDMAAAVPVCDHSNAGSLSRWCLPAQLRTTAGECPETAAIIKLLQNQMLLVQLAVIAETVRAGRAAGIDDTTLAATLRESPMMPPGLRNRIDVLFDPDHAGWFTSLQAAKDVTLALDLAKGEPLPVTEAARDAYRQLDRDGWKTQDIAALVEYGRR